MSSMVHFLCHQRYLQIMLLTFLLIAILCTGFNLLLHVESQQPMASVSSGCGYLSFYPMGGGIGNQLFQLASCYAIAHHLNRILLIPSQDFVSVFDFSRTNVVIAKAEEIKRLAPTKTVNFHIATGYMPRQIALLNSSNLCSPNSVVFVHGYLQSWKYFGKSFKNGILEDLLVFRQELIKAANTLMSNVSLQLGQPQHNVTFVGIHARRGDFVKNKNKVAADPKYIAKVIDFYRQWHYSHSKKHLVFLGFGNDNKWNVENFPRDSDVLVQQSFSPAVDLCVLSLCKDVIMTVGTFGWWGAFLGGGNGIYMKNNAQINSSFHLFDMIPEDHFLPHWIGM